MFYNFLFLVPNRFDNLDNRRGDLEGLKLLRKIIKENAAVYFDIILQNLSTIL